LAELRGHKKLISSVAFSPDGRRIATGSWDDDVSLRLWDASTYQPLQTLAGHKSDVNSVAFTPDGAYLVSSYEDGKVAVWDVFTGTEVSTYQHRGIVSCVRISPDGTQFACSGGTGEVPLDVKLWDATSVHADSEGFASYGSVNGVAFQPHTNRFASYGRDGQIRFWDASTMFPVLSFNSKMDIKSASFDATGSRLVLTSYRGIVEVWDTLKRTRLHTLNQKRAPKSMAVFFPDGSRIVGGSYSHDNSMDNGIIDIWDAQTGEVLVSTRAHEHGINTVAISPDGTRLATGSRDKTVKLWDTANYRLALALNTEEDYVHSIAFSADGSLVASGGGSSSGDRRCGEIRIWNAATGICLHTLRGHSASVSSVTFLPDGTRVVGISEDGTIKFWDTKSGGLTLTLRPGGREGSVSISTEGSTLVSTSLNNGRVFLKTWSAFDTAPNSVELLHARSPQDVRSNVAFNPAGTHFVNGDGREVVVWDLRGRSILHSLKGHNGFVTRVAYNQDGTRIVSIDDKGDTIVWDASQGRRLGGDPPARFEAHYASGGVRLRAVPLDYGFMIVREELEAKTRDRLATARAMRLPLWHIDNATRALAAKELYSFCWHAQRLGNLLEGGHNAVKGLDPRGFDVEVLRRISALLKSQADLSLASGDLMKAETDLMTSITAMQLLSCLDASLTQSRRHLMRAHFILADIRHREGQFASAIDSYSHSWSELESLVAMGASYEETVKSRELLQTRISQCIEVGFAEGDWDEICQLPGDVLSRLLVIRSSSLAKRKRIIDVAQSAAKLMELAAMAPDDRSARVLETSKMGLCYNAACAYGLCVKLASGWDGKDTFQPPGKSTLSPTQLMEFDCYSTLALDALKLAIAAGWVDLSHMRQDPDLAALREHAEFKAITSANR
jgi:WD40 repeat protein